MIEAAYTYDEGDLLEQRNTYTYTAYQGPGFIDAYTAARHTALTRLGTSAAPPPPTTVEWRRGATVDTSDFLDAAWSAFQAGADGAVVRHFGTLLKRFEVTKRIWNAYDADFRGEPTSGYRNLDLYVRFGEVLELAYSRTGSLVYLNALLKCVDTCTAMVGEVTLQGRLAHLIRCELDHVSRLQEERA